MTTLAQPHVPPQSAATLAALPEPPRLPGLDVLRGVAILLVVPHNLMVPSQPTGWLSHLLLAWLERGWLGVHLFFALSGFLITGILLDTARCANGLRVFYARRVLRIFPLYYLALVLGLLVIPALGWPPQPPHDGAALWASYWVFLSNWVTAAPATFPHFWSLAVEEQFYLAWPLLVYRLAPRRVVALGLGLAGVSLAARGVMRLQDVPDEVIYVATLARMGTLVLGGAAAAALRDARLRAWLLQQRRHLPAAVALLLAGATAAGRLHAVGPWQQTLGYDLLSLACVGAVLGVALARPAAPRPAQRLRAAVAVAAALRLAGRYSYGMYVWHVPLAVFIGRPLLAWLGYRLGEQGGGPLLAGAPLAAYVLAGTALSLAVAVLSYHAVEQRFLSLKPAYRV